jgi:hypothetical protein
MNANTPGISGAQMSRSDGESDPSVRWDNCRILGFLADYGAWSDWGLQVEKSGGQDDRQPGVGDWTRFSLSYPRGLTIVFR